jgi:mRNA interferase RelE/StbE
VTYSIQWRPRARKAFLSLDKPVRRRIGEAVDALAADPRPAAAKMITGAHGVLRIRVGDYRVLYTIDEGPHRAGSGCRASQPDLRKVGAGVPSHASSDLVSVRMQGGRPAGCRPSPR